MDSSSLHKELNMNIVTTLYLFVASDDHIARSYLGLMKKKCTDDAFAQININEFDAKKTSGTEVIAACMTLPVLSARRLVIVKDANVGRNTELCAAVAQYAKSPCESTTLVVYTNEIDKRIGLYKAFAQYGKTVEFDKLKSDELAKWIRTAFAKKHLKITEEALAYFMDAGDYNSKDSNIDIGYFANEIEKLASYDNTRNEITLDVIKKVSSVNISEDIFKLSEDLLIGDMSSAYRQLYKLSYHKAVPQMILSSVARTMRNICICQSLYANGKSEASIAKEYGLHPYAVKKANSVRNQFSVSDAKKALLVLGKIDVLIKTGMMDADTALTLMAEDIGSKRFITAGDSIL